MDDAQFWDIVGSGGKKSLADPERQLAAVRKALLKLSPDEIRDFQRLYEEKRVQAHAWDLWGAAYLINGGCSDDGFHYFRDWLISRGRGVFEAAVQNPDSLAGITDPECDEYEFEELGGVAFEVFREKTGQDLVPAPVRQSAKPKGRKWDFDDDEKVAEKLPKLSAAYRI